MRREDGIRPENVDRIVIRGTPTHVKQLGKQAVKTMLDAQFSLPYSVSVSLATGGAMLDQYTPEQLRRPEILALARRVNVVIDAQVTGSEQPFVDVYLTDGRMLTRRVLVPRGAHTNALTDEELRIKFRSNAKLALKDAQVDELEDKVQKVDTLENVADIAALLIPR